jgi:hypothetical protein
LKRTGLAIRMTTKAASTPAKYSAIEIQPRSQSMRPAEANSTAPQHAMPSTAVETCCF